MQVHYNITFLPRCM